jgi:ATP-dependent DNA helicase RecQ
MLIGSQAKDIQKYRLNTLTTFGLLAPLTEPQVSSLIDALLAIRLLQQVEERPHRPLLRLTDRGEAVMKGIEPLSERLPIDVHLQTRLQTLPLRTQHKSASNNKPASASISAKEHAADTFDDINAALAAAAGDVDPLAEQLLPTSEPATKPEHYWTARLLAAGFTIEECQQIRALPRETILEHAAAARLASNGD